MNRTNKHELGNIHITNHVSEGLFVESFIGHPKVVSGPWKRQAGRREKKKKNEEQETQL